MGLLTVLIQAALVVGALGSLPTGCLDNPPPASCQTVLDDVKAARDVERSHWVVNISTDTFYQSPQNVSSYHPGELIRLDRPRKELLQKYKTPPGLTLYRMLYQSTDMDNQTVPASAFILLPYTRPKEPLELIAWAHGTSGIGRHCAPSNQDDLYYQYEAPFSMALQGFAVVAPDYAGQGTDPTFNYLAGPSHAADIAYAVLAARQALPRGIISDRWVVVGHSEGGLTAWATNEREAHTPTGGFLGAVSIGPALANLRIIRANLARTGGKLGDTLLYPAYTIISIARLDPAVDPAQYFSDAGAERMALAETGCYDTAVAAFKNLTYGDLFSDGSWLNASFADAWEARTGVHGDKPLAAPMLLIEGLGDTAVPPAVIDDTFNTQCTMHPDAKVRLSKYPNMDHDAVAFVSQYEYFDWIRDLFDGDGPEKCEVVTVDTVVPEPPTGDGGEVGKGDGKISA